MRINIVCPATMCSTLMLTNFCEQETLQGFVNHALSAVRVAENPLTKIDIWDYPNQVTISGQKTQILRGYKVGQYGYIIASVPDLGSRGHPYKQPWRDIFERLGFTTACPTVKNEKNGTYCALMVVPAEVFMLHLGDLASKFGFSVEGTSLAKDTQPSEKKPS